MRVGIDISQVIYGTGVSTYTKRLVENLLKYYKDTEYVLFGGSLRRTVDLKQFFNGLRGNFGKKVYPLPPYLTNILWNKLHILPIETLIGKVDVFHSSDWTQPPASAFKVTTVHDLSHLKYPKLIHPKIISAQNARLKWVRKEVNRIIVPSTTTKNDLMEEGFDGNIIRVIPEAPGLIFKPAKYEHIKRIKAKYKLNSDYLIAVGINPRKNSLRIIDAFRKLKNERGLTLAFVGRPSHIELPRLNKVRILGYVSEADMPILYSGARALVYPSIYEGFGLPILEAFACQTPVVTSNLGSLKEVARDAAVLVNPKSTQSILEGIKEAFNNKGFLVRKGVKTVKTFSWKKTAEKTYNVYKESKQ